MPENGRIVSGGGEEALTLYFLRDVIDVVRGGISDFIDCMIDLMPVFEGFGWELISADYNLTGRPTRITHTWRLPDANSLERVMKQLPDNSTYLRLQQLVEHEEQELLSTMPYDPRMQKLVEGQRLSREQIVSLGPAAVARKSLRRAV